MISPERSRVLAGHDRLAVIRGHVLWAGWLAKSVGLRLFALDYGSPQRVFVFVYYSHNIYCIRNQNRN